MSKKLPLLFLSSLAVLSLGSCTTQHVHSYDLENPVWEWEQFSSASVSFTCSGCAESEEGHTYTVEADITLKSSEASTCEKAGSKVYEASASFEDHTFTDTKTQPLPASGHKEDDSVWKFDDSKHWHDCLYCGDAKHFQEAEHTLTDWSETIASTYHEEGTKERHCTVCAYTETASIAKLRYTYDQVKAYAEAFLKYEEGSAYLGRSLDSLLDSIENMSEEDKAAHLEEVNAWKEKATKAKTSYDSYYCILVDSEGMDTYTKTKTAAEANEKYGDLLKVNADETLVLGECWDYGSDRKESVLKEGIAAIRFVIYAPQAMNVSFINHECNTWYDVASGQVVHAKKETTMAAGEWREFTIPTSAIEEMDTFHIALYLSPSPYIGYGIPTVGDSAEKGSAYISEIIGIKNAYYDETYAPLFEEAVSKISSTTSPTRADAYYIYKAGQYLSRLSEDAKKALENLEDYNAAKANCAFVFGGLIDASTFAYTDDWGAAGTASNVADSVYGEVLKIAITQSGGAMESAFPGFAIDSEAYDTVSFYVKSDWDTTFDLSKGNWWTNAYDFSAGTWIDNGQNTAFRTGVDTWALCTMSVADFNLCKYYSFLNNGAVGQNFYISPIYLSSSGSN